MMIDLEYCNACTEVLEILKYIPREDYDKIPLKKIEVLKMDRNIRHIFQYDVNKTFEEQGVSEKARLILAVFFRDYWATERQQEMILAKENTDRNKLEEEKREKYNPDDLFKNSKITKEIEEEPIIENTQMVEYKQENVFQKVFSKIKEFLYKYKKRK